MAAVVVAGALGRMGSEVCRAVTSDPELTLAGAVDVVMDGADDALGVSLYPSLAEALAEVPADVLVDFTIASAAIENIRTALEAGLHAVVGTTGLSDEQLAEIRDLSAVTGQNVLLAPNFAVGAVILMDMARKIAPHFDRAEIIELHHNRKADAPSGTAALTARLIGEAHKQESLQEEENVPGVRGGLVNGIPVHSIRLPGLVAHQEVIFGLQGQTLTLRHDSTDRTCFMPGVVLAVKAVSKLPGLTVGLDKVLGIG